MARPRQHDSALRESLLAQATAMIGERGLAGLTLRRLAIASGTSTSAVYSLFGSKEELLAALIQQAFESFTAAQRAALDSESAYAACVPWGTPIATGPRQSPAVPGMFAAPPPPPWTPFARFSRSADGGRVVRTGTIRADTQAAVMGCGHWSTDSSR